MKLTTSVKKLLYIMGLITFSAFVLIGVKTYRNNIDYQVGLQNISKVTNINNLFVEAIKNMSDCATNSVGILNVSSMEELQYQRGKFFRHKVKKFIRHYKNI